MKYLALTLGSAVGLAIAATSVSFSQAPAPKADNCAADATGPSADKSLSDQLDDCNGVLVPPRVGDGEIVEPPPEGGTIRVIPPAAVPDQQNGTARPPSSSNELPPVTDGR